MRRELDSGESILDSTRIARRPQAVAHSPRHAARIHNRPRHANRSHHDVSRISAAILIVQRNIPRPFNDMHRCQSHRHERRSSPQNSIRRMAQTPIRIRRHRRLGKPHRNHPAPRWMHPQQQTRHRIVLKTVAAMMNEIARCNAIENLRASLHQPIRQRFSIQPIKRVSTFRRNRCWRLRLHDCARRSLDLRHWR